MTKEYNPLERKIGTSEQVESDFKLFEAALSDVNGELSFNRSSSENPNDLSLSGNKAHFEQALKIEA